MKEQTEQKLQEKVLYINRCAKVVKGGRKFSFSALVLVGDGMGKVGFGFAKALEVSDAIRKATELAKRDMIGFEICNGTIPHTVIVKQDGVNLLLKPAKEGTGIIAGSMVRSVLELAGVHDIVSKCWGSNNPGNQVRAIFRGLKSLKNREQVEELRKTQ